MEQACQLKTLPEPGASLAVMAAKFFSGLGVGNGSFGPGTDKSQVMSTIWQGSGCIKLLLYERADKRPALLRRDRICIGGCKSSGSVREVFLLERRSQPVTYEYDKFRSVTYDVGPQWQRGTFAPETQKARRHITSGTT